MNAREISDVAIKLKSIINAVEEGSLGRFANEIEAAVIRPFGMFDAKDVASMRQSMGRDGRYTINADDKDSIKNIKATINLLRSVNAAVPTIIAPAVNEVVSYLQTGSKVQAGKGLLSGVVSYATEYVSAKWSDMTKTSVVEYNGVRNPANAPTANRVDQTLAFLGDVSAFKFYISQLGDMIPSMSGLSDEVKQTITRMQGVLNETTAVDVLTQIQEVTDRQNATGGALQFANTVTEKASVSSLERSLAAIGEVASSAISAADKEKYFDNKNGRYRIPDAAKAGPQGLPASQNMMIAFNIADRSRKTLAHINEFMNSWDKSKKLPVTQLPALIELLNKVGKMVKDFQQLDRGQISDLIKEDLQKAMKEIIAGLGPNLPQLAAIAQESELRFGLRDNYLLANIEDISKHYEGLAKAYDVPFTVKYPYPEQKNQIIQKMQGETESRVKDLQQIKAIMAKNKFDGVPSLEELSIMEKQAAKIKTPAGAAYQAAIQTLMEQVSGMDVLKKDIKNAEDKLYKLSQLPLSEQTSDHQQQVKEALQEVKELYGTREMVQATLDNPASSDFVYGEPNVKLPKTLSAAAALAAKDIDGLIKKEQDQAARLTALADNNKKLMTDNKDVKQNRMRAQQTMRMGDLKAAGKQHADAERAARTSVYANAQKKAAATPSDKEILQSIINNKKGAVIVQAQTARKAMLDNARSYLSEAQFACLGPNNKSGGLYQISQNDGLLVMNIKQVSNTLARLETLMERVNQLSEYAAQGGLAYAKIPGLLPGFMADIGSLLEEIKTANLTLSALRESMASTMVGEAGENISQIFADISKHYPSKLLQISTDVQTELLSSIDPAYADRANELFTHANNFIINIDNAVRGKNQQTLATPPPSPRAENKELVRMDSGILTNMVNIMQKHLGNDQALKAKTGQLYKLSAFPAGSKEKQAAGIINALIKLNDSLESTVKISQGKSVIGGADLIKNLYAAYSAINDAAPTLLAAMSPEIKAFLEYCEPIISKFYASAAVTERNLGLREGVMTAQLDQCVKAFVDLGNKYNVNFKESPPYYAAQAAVAETEISRLNGDRKTAPSKPINDIQINHALSLKEDLSARMQQHSARRSHA